jgi:hypothetical protein
MLKLTRDGGALAQLGERVLCKHEVVGSIPSSSTNLCQTARRKVAADDIIRDQETSFAACSSLARKACLFSIIIVKKKTDLEGSSPLPCRKAGGGQGEWSCRRGVLARVHRAAAGHMTAPSPMIHRA